MKRKINLYWYKHKEGHGNFGDELNPYIVEKLTGKKVKYININYFGLPVVIFLKTLTYQLLKTGLSFFDYLENLYFYFIRRPKVLVGIGSVLQSVKTNNCIVWGAGIIESSATFGEADFRAVRGKKTQQRLRELGYKVPEAIGDPAILLPLLYQPKVKKKYKMGIIPHFIHFQEMKTLATDEILVINLLEPIEKVIDQINSCEFTFSSSLHGIIVSHAYGVKSVWITNELNKLSGDDIKFADYFSSVNIVPYKPLNMDLISKHFEENLKLLQVINESSILPVQSSLNKIQKDLIKSFPFETFFYLK
ncbi:MAG TPA: polysaccharide pyruvyl transferase family protein [Flavobacteriaceae bacterium]|nr:polysaccharide pyruvyl transferase family protein [Flavobacteriaceae bacterium]